MASPAKIALFVFILGYSSCVLVHGGMNPCTTADIEGCIQDLGAMEQAQMCSAAPEMLRCLDRLACEATSDDQVTVDDAKNKAKESIDACQKPAEATDASTQSPAAEVTEASKACDQAALDACKTGLPTMQVSRIEECRKAEEVATCVEELLKTCENDAEQEKVVALRKGMDDKKCCKFSEVQACLAVEVKPLTNETASEEECKTISKGMECLTKVACEEPTLKSSMDKMKETLEGNKEVCQEEGYKIVSDDGDGGNSGTSVMATVSTLILTTTAVMFWGL